VVGCSGFETAVRAQCAEKHVEEVRVTLRGRGEHHVEREGDREHPDLVQAEGEGRCAKGNTFSGAEIVACRCSRAVLVARQDGLYCARCEGLVAPQVATVSQSRRPSGGTP
jgi:hypothetical protein